jgi:hypothetical protein
LNISRAYIDVHVLYLFRRGLTIDNVSDIYLIDLIGLVRKGNSRMMIQITQCVRLTLYQNLLEENRIFNHDDQVGNVV